MKKTYKIIQQDRSREVAQRLRNSLSNSIVSKLAK
jgi:hypothetical protein